MHVRSRFSPCRLQLLEVGQHFLAVTLLRGAVFPSHCATACSAHRPLKPADSYCRALVFHYALPIATCRHL